MRIGCGCVGLGSASSSGSWSDHVRLLRSAIETGVSVLDTADAYSGGLSERIVGRAIRGHRDEVTIATKGGYIFRERSRGEQQLRRVVARVRPRRDTPVVTTGHASAASNYAVQDFAPAALRRALEASLRRLDVDHIDVYQLHGPNMLLDDAVDELLDARDAGLIGRIGVGAESVESAVLWARRAEVGVVQVPFGILDPDAAGVALDARDAARDAAPTLWARGVLGGGVLAAAMTTPSVLDDHPKRELVVELQQIASESGMEIDELALRWVGAHPEIGCIMVGVSTPEHLRRNIDLAGLPPLDADVTAAIGAAHQRHHERSVET